MIKRYIGFVLLALLAAAVLFAFRDALSALTGQWKRNPMYSYAFSVPVISAYLLWNRRAAFAALRPRPAWRAAYLLLVFSALMLFGGRLANVRVIEQLAFLVSIVGLVLALLGREYLRVGWAGIAYLLLMVPLWDGFTEPLHPVFQEQSAVVAKQILALVGVPVHRDGIVLTLPNIMIEVARSCSGVNYLVAVFALALPLAYLSLPGVWRRVTLVVAAMIIAALSNGLRVALISILAHFDIGSPLHGPMHILHGLFVAFAGYVAIFFGLYLLTPRAQAPQYAEATTPGSKLTLRPPLAPVVALTAFFVAVGVVPMLGLTTAVELSAGLESLPRNLESWVMEPGPVAEVPFWSGADEQLRRRYVSADGRAVEVYIAYFRSQRQDKEVGNFRSDPLHRRAARLLVGLPNGNVLPANAVTAEDAEDVDRIFWYEIDGHVETSQRDAKLRTLWNTVRYRRSNAAVVMLSAVRATGDGAETSAHGLQQLAALIHESLGQLLPAGAAAAGQRLLAATSPH